MKNKKLTLILLVLSMILICIYIGTVAYNWGYIQSAIDNSVATFSTPAYVSMFSNMPYAVVSFTLAIMALFRARKRKSKSKPNVDVNI